MSQSTQPLPEDLVPVVPEGGNTNPPSGRISPAKHWVFTFNNYEETDLVPLCQRFQEIAEKYFFAKEVGESGTPHLQGVISFKKKVRPRSIGVPLTIHWEKRRGSWEDAVKYCQKEDGDKFHFGFRPKRPLKTLACEGNFHPWQEKVLETVRSEPDDRTILWVWEDVGRVGKTTFLKYLMRHEDAIPLEGKKNDVLYVAAENESEIYILDLERSMESYVSYASIEKVKNGCFMVGKYEGKIVDRNCPHVVVFANFPPEREKLSLDRWKVFRIVDLDLEEDDGEPRFNSL